MSRRLAMFVLVILAACTSDQTPRPSTPIVTSTTGTTTTTVTTTTTTTTHVPPPVGGLTAADLPSSWRAGCPVAPSQLRMLEIEYWGFDDQRHLGKLVVNARVATAVARVFATLYRERFPIRRMEPVDIYGGSDEASMDADNTSGFNCRPAVASGPPRWSSHAYGLAIDVNPVENPYIQGGQVQPPAGQEYVQRSPYRPGMAVPGGVLERAFASAGWQWGGRWTGTPDYQHFSSSGG